MKTIQINRSINGIIESDKYILIIFLNIYNLVNNPLLLEIIDNNASHGEHCGLALFPTIAQTIKVLTHRERGDVTQICEGFASQSLLYTPSATRMCIYNSLSQPVEKNKGQVEI